MSLSSWNQLISKFSNPHLLQTSQWAEVKSQAGWKAHYLVWQFEDQHLELTRASSGSGPFDFRDPAAAALVLERRVLPGLSILYAPKGPLLKDWTDQSLRDQVLIDLEAFARKSKAIQIKIDPDLAVGRGVPGADGSTEDPEGNRFLADLVQRGWLFSSDQIQFRNTVLVDLQEEEDQILARMKSKTRYNIRLSARKGITIRQGSEKDLAALYQMYARTSIRGDFTIRSEDYYQTLWKAFLPREENTALDPLAQPLIAEFEGQPVAGAVIFKFADQAWYLHGMSLPEHSEKMAPHLVQWEAIRWAKSRGCQVYDMWGAPDVFDESDPLGGVYRFKSGYGGEVFRTVGAWDFPARPFFYHLFTSWVPKVLNVMRWFGNRQIRRISHQDPQ